MIDIYPPPPNKLNKHLSQESILTGGRSQESLALEDLPSMRKRKRDHENLIRWQEKELEREHKDREECDKLVNDFVDNLQRDTIKAAENVAKVFNV